MAKAKSRNQAPKVCFQLHMPCYIPGIAPYQAFQRRSEAWRLLSQVGANDVKDDRQGFHNVANGLTMILRQSRSLAKGEHLGTRSLFSTCLAVVPQLIAEEHDVPSEDSKYHLSTNVYGELEEFGSLGPPGSGWKHLGEIVRHHAILLVANAITEGAIGVAGARELIGISLCEGAADAAQRFLEGTLSRLSAVVNTKGALVTPGACTNLLDILHGFCVSTGRLEYAHQWYAQFLEGEM